MDAEFMTILQNIQALIEQAKQMAGGAAQAGAGEASEGGELEKIMKYLKEMEGSKSDDAEDAAENKDKEVAKAEQAKLAPEDKGATASDDAAARIDEQGEVQDKNLNEVAKALMAFMAQKKAQPVRKSSDDILVAIKPFAEKLAEVEKSITLLYEGMGVADQIKKANEVKKAQDVQRPVNDESEIKKSLEYIINAVKGSGAVQKPAEGKTWGEQSDLHKSLTDGDGALLRGLFSYNSNLMK